MILSPQPTLSEPSNPAPILPQIGWPEGTDSGEAGPHTRVGAGVNHRITTAAPVVAPIVPPSTVCTGIIAVREGEQASGFDLWSGGTWKGATAIAVLPR